MTRLKNLANSLTLTTEELSMNEYYGRMSTIVQDIFKANAKLPAEQQGFSWGYLNDMVHKEFEQQHGEENVNYLTYLAFEAILADLRNRGCVIEHCGVFRMKE
jgi:hypothetical protein